MARWSTSDPLRDNNFWLYDVAPIDFAPALPLFTPLSGFSAVTAPEITVEPQQINEGNWPYTKVAVKSASIGPISLSRGVTWFNADFWRWITAAIEGTTGTTGLQIGGITYRRTLLLVHFFRNIPFSDPGGQIAMAAGLTGALSTVTGFAVGAESGLQNGALAGVASATQLGSLQVSGGFSPPTVGVKVPARAFLLKNCIPIRYKTGSDYDATSGQVSIQELDLQPETVEEITLFA